MLEAFSSEGRSAQIALVLGNAGGALSSSAKGVELDDRPAWKAQGHDLQSHATGHACATIEI